MDPPDLIPNHSNHKTGHVYNRTMGRLTRRPTGSGINITKERVSMRKRENSVQYEMCKTALKNITNDHTINTYKHRIKDFAEWVKGEYKVNKPSVAQERAVELVQAYEKYLESKERYTPATIHGYLAPVCTGLQISLADIEKPKRTSDTIIRGRNPNANPQGRREAQMEKYKPLVDLQRATGFRRAELGKLRGRDLQKDESGYTCIHVKGKHGKEQLQRILPEDLQGVLAAFKNVQPNQLVLSQEIMDNKINLHAMRADQGYRTYQYYKDKLEKDPGYRRQCQKELAMRYRSCIPEGHDYKKFAREILSSTPYKLRGKNREKAIKTGRPTEYNRLALMMVSVFHLSHWRLDVTVTNYILQ